MVIYDHLLLIMPGNPKFFRVFYFKIMALNYKILDKKFKEALKKLDDMPKDEVQKLVDEYFPEDTRPTGWISIEDDLPACMTMDYVEKGYTTVKVKDKDGNEYDTRVGDSLTWYYDVKKNGVTHWWYEK